MLVFIGLLIVLCCVIGSYVAMGGKILVLWQPWEFIIIAGAAVGAMVVSNTPAILKGAMKSFAAAFSGNNIQKADYIELLVFLHKIIKIIKAKGMMSLEKDIENPFQSEIFSPYKRVLKNKDAVIFMCDYLRMMLMGADKPAQIYNTMEEELDIFKREKEEAVTALSTMADSLPAIGIVAAVLGVIKTMGAISEPPAVLGKMIAAALIGTFLGIFLSYGFVGPVARKAGLVLQSQMVYYECIKEIMVAFAEGVQPAIAIELGRKTIPESVRPSFAEVETAVQNDAKPS